MACDTFLKIVQKCKRKFFIIQVGESEPFISELPSGLATTVADLEPHQSHTFYESVGHMIQAESVSQKRDEYLQRLMELPNEEAYETTTNKRNVKDSDPGLEKVDLSSPFAYSTLLVTFDNKVWLAVSGGLKKGRVLGMGMRVRSMDFFDARSLMRRLRSYSLRLFSCSFTSRFQFSQKKDGAGTPSQLQACSLAPSPLPSSFSFFSFEFFHLRLRKKGRNPLAVAASPTRPSPAPILFSSSVIFFSFSQVTTAHTQHGLHNSDGPSRLTTAQTQEAHLRE